MSEANETAGTEVKPDASRKVAIVGEIPFSGRALAKAIGDAGLVARVLCPDSAAEAALKSLPAHSIEIVEGSLESDAAISSALEGVYGVCFLSPITFSGRMYRAKEHLDDVKRVIHASESHGLRKVVYHSAVGAGQGARSRALQDSFLAEELLDKSRCEDFRIRTGPLMGRGDGFMTEIVARARKSGPFMTILGYGGTLVQPIEVGDFARCMAQIFTPASDTLKNGLYALVGPETRSLLELTDSALSLAERNKLKFHAPLFALSLAANAGDARFKERVGLLFDAFAVEQNDAAKLFGTEMKLVSPAEVQRQLLAV